MWQSQLAITAPEHVLKLMSSLPSVIKIFEKKLKNMKNITRCLPIVFSISAALGVSPVVQAVDKEWVCGTDYWDVSACWTPTGQPMSNLDPIPPDSVFLTSSGASDIVITYRNTTNPSDKLGEIQLNATGAGTIRLEQTLNDALSAGNLIVGRDGSGEYLQTAGTSSFDGASIGALVGSSGRFELGGSGAVTFGGLEVGHQGTGTFVQTGGTVLTGGMGIGVEAGGSGSYTLAGGILTVGDSVSRSGVEEVGRWGTGSFIQEAGTIHNVFGSLTLGRKAGLLGAPATGTYTMNGGTLNADLLQVGVIPPVVSNTPNVFPYVHEASDGHFIQNDGIVTVVKNIVISASGGARGQYELRGGSLTANNVLNNDRFEYSGGSLNSGIENHALLTFSGAGIRTVTGSVTNVGQTTYAQYNEALDPPVLVYQETKNGVVSLADGTRVSIEMDLTLDELGILDIELGSSFFGFDELTPWISVGGTASIDGILDLTDISGWSPSRGDSWTILEAGTVSGLFDTVLFPVLPDGSWILAYDADKILLTAVPVPAAVWLFGSGLLGLVGIARRKKAA